MSLSKLKLGTNIDIVDPDHYYAWLNEVNERGEVLNCMALGYITRAQCSKARDAIKILNELRGTP